MKRAISCAFNYATGGDKHTTFCARTFQSAWGSHGSPRSKRFWRKVEAVMNFIHPEPEHCLWAFNRQLQRNMNRTDR